MQFETKFKNQARLQDRWPEEFCPEIIVSSQTDKFYYLTFIDGEDRDTQKIHRKEVDERFIDFYSDEALKARL